MFRAFVFATVAAAGFPAEAADRWAVDYDRSRVGFEATQQGQGFTGEFKTFKVDISFSADDLENSEVVAEIDVSSVDAGSRQRNGALPDPEWFDVKSHPKAVFRASDFEAVEGGYVAKGALTMKGVSRDVVLPFTLEDAGDGVVMTGRTQLVRTQFDVGTGEWASGEWVGLDVVVTIVLYAERV